MSKPTRVKYLGIEEGSFKGEVVLMFKDEAGNKIELSIANEEAEELWNDLEDHIFKGPD